MGILSRMSESDRLRPFMMENSTWLEERGPLYAAVIPILVIKCCIAIVVNGLVLVAARRIPPGKWTSTLMLTMSLAGSDTFLATVVAVGLIYNSYIPVVNNVHFYGHNCGAFIIESLRLGSIATSVLHLGALAYSQLRACEATYVVRRSHPTLQAADWRKWKLLAALLWIGPMLFFAILFSCAPGEGFRDPNCKLGSVFSGVKFRALVMTVLMLPLPVMMVAYVRTILRVQKLKKQSDLIRRRSSFTIRCNKLIATVTTTLMITGSFVVLMMPSYLLYVLVCHNCLVETADPMVLFGMSIVSNGALILKSLVNPFLYAIRIPEVNGAVKGSTGNEEHSRSKRSQDLLELTAPRSQPVNGRRRTLQN